MTGKYSRVPFDEIPQVRDYRCLTSKEQHEYFGRNSCPYDLTLSTWLLEVLKDDVLMHIPLRDSQKLQSEIMNTLSRNLAYFKIFPQRFGYKMRNIIASTIMYLQHRLMRVRSGHKLPPLSLRPLTKKEFGRLVTVVTDNMVLDSYADYWVGRFNGRVKRGVIDRSTL